MVLRSARFARETSAINAGIIKMVCDGINYCKTDISKIDGCHYEFEYVCRENMPDNYKKSANKRERKLSCEDKKKRQKECFKHWAKKKYICMRCNKTITNGCKYLHNKICN